MSENCELLAENDQTAKPEARSGWSYSIRPNCAGICLCFVLCVLLIVEVQHGKTAIMNLLFQR